MHHINFLSIIKGLKAAEIGCGTGYGSAILAETAKYIIGIDRSYKAIKIAKFYHKNSNLNFICCDAFDVEDRLNNIEAIVTCHFIEHLKDQLAFLKLAKRILSYPGLFCVATPNRMVSMIENPYHYCELNHQELENLLGAVFSHVEMYSLVPSERFKAYRELRRATVEKIYALDFLRLRDLLPCEFCNYSLT